jgi:hypothetical protein
LPLPPPQAVNSTVMLNAKAKYLVFESRLNTFPSNKDCNDRVSASFVSESGRNMQWMEALATTDLRW